MCNLSLFPLQIPANAKFANSMIMSIVNFDLIPTDKIYDKAFNFSKIVVSEASNGTSG